MNLSKYYKQMVIFKSNFIFTPHFRISKINSTNVVLYIIGTLHIKFKNTIIYKTVSKHSQNTAFSYIKRQQLQLTL